MYVMRTSFRERLDVMNLLRWSEQPIHRALRAERVCGNIRRADFAPLVVISLGCLRVAPVLLIVRRLYSGVLWAK
jgi:hypothetical protein